KAQKNDGEKSMIVELRADGAQTVVPPSIHPSGESIEFANPPNWKPTEIVYADLLKRVSQVAAATLLVRYGGLSDDEAIDLVQSAESTRIDELNLPDAAKQCIRSWLGLASQRPKSTDDGEIATPLDERRRRASLYLKKVEPAISGHGGHNKTW